MRKNKKYILILIAFLVTGNYFSQESQKDFQVWTNLESEAGINKRWMVHVQQQTRFIENASTYAYSYFDLGGLYRFSRNLRFTFNYIYVDKKRVDVSYSYRHQFEGYFTYRKKIGKFVFFDRLLGDMQFKDFNADPQGNRLRDFYVRNKFTVRYKLPFKFTPYLAGESYYKFDGMYYEKGFNRFRVFGGLLYNLTDLWLAEVFYMVEFNHDAKTPTNNYILSFGIVRTFFQ